MSVQRRNRPQLLGYATSIIVAAVAFVVWGLRDPGTAATQASGGLPEVPKAAVAPSEVAANIRAGNWFDKSVVPEALGPEGELIPLDLAGQSDEESPFLDPDFHSTYVVDANAGPPRDVGQPMDPADPPEQSSSVTRHLGAYLDVDSGGELPAGPAREVRHLGEFADPDLAGYP
jgi:hypothetical protein